MSKPAAKTKKFTRRFRRAPFISVIAIAIISVAAITVISRQRNAAKAPVGAGQKANPVKTASYVTNHAHAQDVQVPSSASEIKPLTTQEAEKLATELGPMLDQSTEDVPQVRRSDGSVAMDLDGRFQNVTVARVNKDGTVSQSCVDNPRAAGQFFGIDPRMIERAQTRRAKINPK